MRQHRLTGFVLAGGKSSRMGVDKAGLSLNGRTLLDHVLAAMRPVCDQVFIIGPRAQYEDFGPGYEDIFPGCGPLSGVHTALTHSRTPMNLVLAVDTPFLTAELLDYLADRAENSSYTVVAPVVAGQIQPLCAAYSRSFLSIAEAALNAGKYKLAALFPREKTLMIPEDDLRRFAFAPEMFENLNTPEDLEHARQRISGQKP
jgi:molybdopterin-guanine dinucleotide biosynthesis protein A